MKGLDGRALEQVAEYFQVLAEPTRLCLLNALCDGEMNVSELTQIADCSQANVSKHLSLLARTGFVARRKSGTSIFYSIGEPSVHRICDLVCGQIAKRLGGQKVIQTMLRQVARPRSNPKS